jgi:hypothetical protein
VRVIAEAKPTRGFDEMANFNINAHRPKAIWMPESERFILAGEPAAKRAASHPSHHRRCVGDRRSIESKGSWRDCGVSHDPRVSQAPGYNNSIRDHPSDNCDFDIDQIHIMDWHFSN